MDGGLGRNQPCDDLETQAFEVEAIVPAADVTGNNTQSLENAADFDIAGGLERDEVAELVSMRVRATMYIDTDSNAADSGEFRGSYELSTDSGFHVYDGSDFNAGVDGTDIDTNVWETTSPDLIDFGSVVSSSSFEDEANGAGGAAGYADIDRHVAFHSFLDEGPTYDRHNDLNVHVRLNNQNVDDAGYKLIVQAQLLWNVVENC